MGIVKLDRGEAKSKNEGKGKEFVVLTLDRGIEEAGSSVLAKNIKDEGASILIGVGARGARGREQPLQRMAPMAHHSSGASGDLTLQRHVTVEKRGCRWAGPVRTIPFLIYSKIFKPI
jgi:hypothetical protein